MTENWKNVSLLAGGVLIGTAGIKALCSRDAKKLYTHVTAVTLRTKKSIMHTYDLFKESCGDILSDAKDINENLEKEAEAAVIGEEK